MPEHGDERNRHTHREIKMTELVYLETGKPINISYVAQQGDRAERWCGQCEKWVAIGAGLNGSILGFILCPNCGTEWSEKR